MQVITEAQRELELLGPSLADKTIRVRQACAKVNRIKTIAKACAGLAKNAARSAVFAQACCDAAAFGLLPTNERKMRTLLAATIEAFSNSARCSKPLLNPTPR